MKTDIENKIREYIDKPEYRLLSSTKISKRILHDHNGKFAGFTSYDALRKHVDIIKRNPINKTTSIDFGDSEFKIDIPAGFFTDRKPYILPPNCNKILQIMDVHIPYHDAMALTLALKFGYEKGINTIIINGDFTDFHCISRFSKKPTAPGLKIELDITRDILTKIRERFPTCKIIFKDGNHEERLQTYLCNQARELYELPNGSEINLYNLLQLGKLNIDYITDKRIIKAGKLNIIHGHEIGSGSATINIARTVRLKANENILFGHWHRTNEDVARNINNDLIGSWAVGCLCDLSPDYASINQWNHGFAYVEIDNDGGFEVDNKKIINGMVK